MPVRVSYKKQFTLMIMLLLVILVTVEVLVNIWLYYFYTCAFEKNEIFKNADPETTRKVCLESIGYGFAKQKLTKINGTGLDPNIRFGNVDENVVYINSEGFRGPEFTKNKPENVYRIFILGGSTTFGAGVLDNQTYPHFLQTMFDEANLNFKVQVINTGWPGKWSKQETELIKERLLDFEPDLFIVYDGVNDIDQVRRKDPHASATLWMQRWMEICELGKSFGYESIVTLQPMVGTGKKILTEQEYVNFLKFKEQRVTEIYPPFVEELEKLKIHCSVTEDLRGIFDNVPEPIFYDVSHTGPKGNQIIAKKFYELSLPLALENSKNNVFEKGNHESLIIEIDDQLFLNNVNSFFENSYISLREIVSPYKTPRVLPLIFHS